jgi:hypothetical protein
MRLHLIKSTSIILACTFLFEIFFPTISMALTSGSTQPEVWSYQPVDATDNVSLTSGKFNYTIPITSIPEYPMAIGYSSGSQMDQEGGMFGIGFNGSSGAIARSVMGLPDDVKEGEKNFQFSNQARWDASVTGTLSETVPIPLLSTYCSATQNVSLQIGYCNYTGVYGAISLGFGLSKKISQIGNLISSGGIGAFIKNDSREDGMMAGVGASLGICYNLRIPGINGNSHAVPLYTSLAGAAAISKKGGSGAYIYSEVGKSVFPVRNESVITSISPLSLVTTNNSGWGISLPPIPIVGAFSITASYSKFNFGNEEFNKSAYGFMYLRDNFRRDRTQLADMTTEGEDSYNEQARNTPTFLQRDFFTVNAMGMIGSMQMFQKEYGVVSRNYQRSQFRDYSLAGIKTQRNEIYPWVKISQARQKKGVDIIALLKKKENPEDKDFDNVIFEENELRSLTTDADRFGDTEFKMRGDLAGQYNVSSASATDHDVNRIDAGYISGTGGGPKYHFLKEEQDMPLYHPKIVDSDTWTAHEFKRGTNIVKKTVYDLLRTIPPVEATSHHNLKSTPADQADYFRWNQSFYEHYYYTGTSPKDVYDDFNSSHNTEQFNILAHINELKNEPAGLKLDNTIASIEVTNQNGLRYIFNLPVYVKSNTSIQLSGKGDLPPGMPSSMDNYHSFGDKDRNKVTVNDNYYYPYAWMLTAIVGDDYIDFDKVPGPSDGDIGYWVKFRYTKTSNDYRFRSPYSGLDHLASALHKYDDDMYFCSSGTKEIYFLTEIESPSYICKYNFGKRFDALDAAGIYSGPSYNSITQTPSYTDATGNNSQFLVTQIDLYKKHFDGNNSKTIDPLDVKPIKSTKFYYDYSTCQHVLNNYSNWHANSILAADVRYHIDYDALNPNTPLIYIRDGKATLRKVQHIAYDEDGNDLALPSYQFKYWGDDNAVYNPDYDKSAVDQWGNYYKNAKCPHEYNSTNQHYTHYTEINKHEADENSKAYNLKAISLPSGGTMNIDYQAQSYGYVQDQTPYVMRKVLNLNNSSFFPSNVSTVELTVDISDLEYINNLGQPDNEGLFAPLNPILSTTSSEGRNIYGEIAFYQMNKPGSTNTPDEKELYVAAEVAELATTVSNHGNPSYNSTTKTWSQTIILQGKNTTGISHTPFYFDYKRYMYTESFQMREIKENVVNLNHYATYENDNAWDAVNKIVTNVRNIFATDANFEWRFNDRWGEPGAMGIYEPLSFIRTPIGKAKYTGSVVKSIVLKDGFEYATSDDGQSAIKSENEYGTRYYYDEKGDDTGRSSGATSIEPGGGKSAVIDMLATTGVGFAAPPQIISSKTTVENIYKNDERSGTTTGNTISRNKGKTVYEFYTSKDNEFNFKNNIVSKTWNAPPDSPQGHFYIFGLWTFFMIKFKIFGRKVRIKIPLWLPITVNWKRRDYYHLKSYAYTDNTDIYGRPKNITQYDASNTQIGNQGYEYYGTNDAVPVYGKTLKFAGVATDNGAQITKPGMMDQTWSEAYYTKDSRINLVPYALLLNANTHRDFSFTNMKYSYIPPVLKKITTDLDGLTTESSSTGFDQISGSPIETRSKDSYGRTKILRSVPAYWQYSEMGSSSDDPLYVNRLTENCETDLYLDDAGHSFQKILGAGVVTWDKNNYRTNSNKWDIANYNRPLRVPGANGTYSYGYDFIPGIVIEAAYNSTARSGDNYLKRNAVLFKPVSGFTYESELNNDGTFKLPYVPFDFGLTVNVKPWKILNTNNLFSENGVLLESKDPLNKYASQMLGYSISNTIGTTSNATWASAVFDGAENSFNPAVDNPPTISSLNYLTENTRVKLQNARIVEKCDRKFINKILNSASFQTLGHNFHDYGRVVYIDLPGSVTPNIPFSKIDVTFFNGQIRSLYISRDDLGNYHLESNLGEDFTGFFTFIPPTPQLSTCGVSSDVQLYFAAEDFDSFAIDPTFIVAGFSTCTPADNVGITWCNYVDREYWIPENDCISETHTGNFAFRLDPPVQGQSASIGTVVELSKNALRSNATELRRKYKAMVWVYNLCKKDDTELVIEKLSLTNALLSTQSSNMLTPYTKAGNWSLLRLDFDLSLIDINTQKVNVFIRNKSKNGFVIYDDYRVLPYDAEMTNFVFDHKFNRVESTLDGENFASYSDYDQRGRVKETAVELQDHGKNVVKKFLYNNQKAQ